MKLGEVGQRYRYTKQYFRPVYNLIPFHISSLSLSLSLSLSRPDIVYSASSPDENALVSAARHFGYFFYKRSTQTATIQNIRQNIDFEFQVLNVLKFSSKRKRSR